jgi:hypothetical protein
LARPLTNVLSKAKASLSGATFGTVSMIYQAWFKMLTCHKHSSLFEFDCVSLSINFIAYILSGSDIEQTANTYKLNTNKEIINPAKPNLSN